MKDKRSVDYVLDSEGKDKATEKNTSSDGNKANSFLINIGFRQVQILEDASEAIDQKGGILLGFLAVVIALALSGPITDPLDPLNMLFGYIAIAVLVASLIVLIVCLTPKARRIDPDVTKLFDNLWDKSLDYAQENIAAALRNVWETNKKVHDKKATLFELALWLTLAGLVILALDILVIRAII